MKLVFELAIMDDITHTDAKKKKYTGVVKTANSIKLELKAPIEIAIKNFQQTLGYSLPGLLKNAVEDYNAELDVQTEKLVLEAEKANKPAEKVKDPKEKADKPAEKPKELEKQVGQ